MTRSVVVPWAALAPGRPPRPQPGDTLLRLAYARPELLRRRGLRWRLDQFPFGPVHPWFLNDVVRYHADRPGHRAAIGSEAGRRWRAALRADAARVAPPPGPASIG
ncbi:hypothetical protein [Micromonospora sp. SL4-19]|uniref:hypothetical protein n=1 Tax=Micromonospora sp. SL4-19 TaxID=3399129 RepID=UPI003A4DF716